MHDIADPPPVELSNVTLVLNGSQILGGISWRVQADERWVVLGPNGSGKSTLVDVVSFRHHPTTGTVTVLGCELGKVDVRELRPRIGISGASLADQLRPGLRVEDVVMSARHGALEVWWHEYDDRDRARAAELLEQVGCDEFMDRRFGSLSSGERQRVLLARTLMPDPDLVLLDEVGAGLDIGGREQLLAALSHLALDDTMPPTVLVTHHVEEIPVGFTHALLLKNGRIAAAGPIRDTISTESVSGLFGLAVEVRCEAGRWTARTAG